MNRLNTMHRLNIKADSEDVALTAAFFSLYQIVELDPDTLERRWILSSQNHQLFPIGDYYPPITKPDGGPQWVGGWSGILYVIPEIFESVMSIWDTVAVSQGLKLVDDIPIDPIGLTK